MTWARILGLWRCCGGVIGSPSAPPLSSEPIPFPAYTLSSIRGKALAQQVLSLVEKGAIELAPLPLPGFYSRLFVVMKASGSWRPVIDLSTLNLRVLKSPFKMETLQSVLLSVRHGNWMVSLDLKDAYLQVPAHPDSRKFLGFIALEQVFSSKVYASDSPRLLRFLPGSWLRCQLFYIAQAFTSIGISTTGFSRPPLATSFSRPLILSFDCVSRWEL